MKYMIYVSHLIWMLHWWNIWSMYHTWSGCYTDEIDDIYLSHLIWMSPKTLKKYMIYVSHLIWMLLKTLMKYMIWMLHWWNRWYIFITLDLDVPKNTEEIYDLCITLDLDVTKNTEEIYDLCITLDLDVTKNTDEIDEIDDIYIYHTWSGCY